MNQALNRKIVVLPGLDGTGLLLKRFCEYAPDGVDVEVLALPNDPIDDYDTIGDFISERIRGLESCDLVTESFSGPIGILLAHRHPEIVRSLTLVASFANSPAPAFAKVIPWSILVRLPMPSFFAKRFLVGSDDSLVSELKRAIRQTSPKTLVRRLQCLMNIDVTGPLSELKSELIYIRPIQDRLIPKRTVETIVAANPAVSVREIDGPHMILQTSPGQVWELIDNAKRNRNSQT